VGRYKSESEVSIVCIVVPRQGLTSAAAPFGQEGAMS